MDAATIWKEVIGLGTENADPSILVRFIRFAIWSTLIVLLGNLVQRALNNSIEDNASRYKGKKIVRFATFLIIALLALFYFTGQGKYFGLSIGLLSAGIAFTLQEVILSFAGWISIFTTKVYKPGDRIEINGIKGDVIDIGFTRTTLMEIGEWVDSDNYNGRIVQMSNGFVFKSPIHNYSSDFPFVWDSITLPIKYGSDIEMAKNIVSKIAHDQLSEYVDYASEHWKNVVKKYLIEDAVIAPSISLTLTDNWINLHLRFIVDYKRRRSSKNVLNEAILEAINNSNGKVSLASATHEIVGLPAIEIKK
jgi:small-conductance mechanosensitive channel